VEWRLSLYTRKILTDMQSRKLERLQKHSQNIQAYLLWWQDRWNCEQEVWSIGANKLGQKMQTPSSRSH